ncbi:MAG: MFS transporter [Paracoccaceae bacterium]
MDRPARSSEFTPAAISVVGLCFVLNTLARGNGETFAVFLGPLEDTFHWGRAATSSIYSVFMIALGFSGPVIGALFDRFGGRMVYVLGLLAYGAGFLIASRMQELWHAWLSVGVLAGIGATATGMTPATGIISRWFERNMAFAIAFAYAGFAAGSVLLSPLSGWMIETGGWRWTYQTLGLFLLALAIVVAMLPWGRIEAGIKPATPPRRLIPGREVFASVPFWALFVVFFMTSVTTYVVQVQAVEFLTDAGYPRLTATFLYGLTAAMSLGGIVGAGWLADRYGQRRIATLGYSMSIIGILALMALANGPNLMLLAVFLISFGGAMGSRGPIVSSLTARLFEGQVGAVFGLIMIGLGLGGAFGAWVSGWLFDLTGGYSAGLMVAIGASAIGMATFWIVPALDFQPQSAEGSASRSRRA